MADTSLPDLTPALNHVYDIDITKEARHKEFIPVCVDFFKALLEEMLCGQLLKHLQARLCHFILIASK